MSKWTQALAVTALIVVTTSASAANAGSVENMERERAILLETYLAPPTTFAGGPVWSD